MEETVINKGTRLIIIGGSAGSLKILLPLLSAIKKEFKFIVAIILHRGASDSALAELLSAKTGLTIREVEDKDAAEKGVVYLAPGDYHLLFEKERLFSLDASEKVNFSRPSIDVAFESAAKVYGPGVTAILLSGANADGTEGLNEIKKMGGATIVQQPSTAQSPFMPQHAIDHARVDHIMDQSGLIEFLNGLN